MFRLTDFPSFVYASQKLDELAPEGYSYNFNEDDNRLLVSFVNEDAAMEFDIDGKVYIYELGLAFEMFTDVDEALEHLAGIFQ